MRWIWLIKMVLRAFLSENNELIVIGAENEYMAVSRKNYFTNRTRMTTIDLSSLDKFWNHIDYTM